MTRPMEDRLHDALSDQVSDVRADPGIVERAITAGRRRRRQRRGGVAVAAAAAVMAAVTLPTWVPDVVPGSWDPGIANTPRPGPSPDTTFVPSLPAGAVAKWVSDLPQGEPPDLAYYAGGDFYDGDLRVPLVAGQVGWGRAEGGWLVSTNNGTQTSFGVVSPSGDFREVVANYGRARAYVSPVGDRFALLTRDRSGSRLDVFDVATGDLVDSLSTAESLEVGEWTSEGIFYRTGRGLNVLPGPTEQAWIWEPGTEPRSLDLPAVDVNLAFNRALIPTRPTPGPGSSYTLCAEVVRLESGQAGEVLYGGCEEEAPDARTTEAGSGGALSPDGGYAVVDSLGLDVVRLEDGKVSTFEGRSTSPQTETYVWEDEENLLRAVLVGKSLRNVALAVIRCSAATLECERVYPSPERPEPFDLNGFNPVEP